MASTPFSKASSITFARISPHPSRGSGILVVR
jgi:hypothetical protein